MSLLLTAPQRGSLPTGRRCNAMSTMRLRSESDASASMPGVLLVSNCYRRLTGWRRCAMPTLRPPLI
eukprot:11228359-Lingulodinium_polyedra.AAC.3